MRAMRDEDEGAARRAVGLAALVLLVAAAGLLLHVRSEGARLHDPVAGLRQIDLLFLDEAAPLLDRVGGAPERGVLVLVVCDGCALPTLRDDVAAEVRRTDDLEVAAAYGLAVAPGASSGAGFEAGRIGPGYALIDARGHVRYRTFDPVLAGNGEELRVLIRAISGGQADR